MSGIGESDLARFRPQLEAALSYGGGTITIEDVEAGVRAGKYQLWPGEHSVLVTEIAEFPRQRALNICWAGGHLPEIEVILPIVLAWGRDKGCTRARFVGRRGWERTFIRNLGWHATGVQMETDL